MPIIGPELISSWYTLKYNPVNGPSGNLSDIFLFENWSEDSRQQVSDVPLLQGDIGPHVASVGSMVYTTTISTPSIIYENTPSNVPYGDIFLLLIEKFEIVRNPQALINEIQRTKPNLSGFSLLKSATITINAEDNPSVRVEMTLISQTPRIFIPVLNLNGPPGGNFIGRTAAYWDTMFRMQVADGQLGAPFGISKGTIHIEVDISEKYFNGGLVQTPYFAINGYSVTGNLTVWARPDAIPGEQGTYGDSTLGYSNGNFPYIAYQTPNQFNVGSALSTLTIGNANSSPTIILGTAFLSPQERRSLSPGQLTTVEVELKHFATSSLVG